MNSIGKRACCAFAIVALHLAIGETACGGDVFVNDAADTGGNGAGWETAFKCLQDGLAAATDGDIVWVAQGTYRPDEDDTYPDGDGDRTASFEAEGGVTVLGGFAGDEDYAYERDPLANVTILSGDLDEDDDPISDSPFYDNYDDNSYHVIDGRFETGVRFEGFTVIGGNADYDGTDMNRQHQKHGGGALTARGVMYVNCIFKYNYAIQTGGGISAHDTTGVMAYNCTFLVNRGGQYGGAILVDESEYDHHIVNCVFNLNVAGNSGGAVRASGGTEDGCDVFMDDCTFWDNRAYTGGAVKAQTYSDVQIQNSIIWGHEDDDNDYQLTVDTSTSSLTVYYCDIYNEAGNQLPPGVGGSNNIFNEDPLFVDGKPGLGVDDDLRLFGGSQGHDPSPCIDEGDDSRLPDDLADLNENQNTTEDIPYDRDYITRVLTGDLDMGAYEGSYYCAGDVNRDGAVDIDDVFDVLAAWGSCPGCPEDVNGDDTVDIDDLFAVLADWYCGKPTAQTAPQSVYDCITLYASDPEDLATCLEAIQLTGGQ